MDWTGLGWTGLGGDGYDFPFCANFDVVGIGGEESPAWDGMCIGISGCI
jgi:hypothetical protein